MDEVNAKLVKKILAQMESGDVAPWRCPWVKTGEPTMPYNLATKRPYTFGNVWFLWAAANESAFTSNAWATMKQANELGGKVKKGSSGTPLVFFKKLEEEVDGEKRERMVIRHFTVFNLDQLVGLDKERVIETPSACDQNALLEKTAMAYIASQSIRLVHGGDRALYHPGQDCIRMPAQFPTTSDYLSVITHEIAHSTGRQSRLGRHDRIKTWFDSKDQAYAFEELVAELCACLWCAQSDISYDRPDHASYLSHWFDLLKREPKWFLRAARMASQALSYAQTQADIHMRKAQKNSQEEIA